jgi:ATP-binding cassette subfamily B protein
MPTQTRRAPARSDADRSHLPPHPPRAAEALLLQRDDPAVRPSGRVRRFLSYYRPHLPLLAADVGCALLVSLTALVLPLCARSVTQRLQDGALPDLAPIYAMGGVMLALLAVQTASFLFVDYKGHVMGARMEGALRRELFEHCQKLSFSFYDRQRVGQLMSRITHDLSSLGELYHHGPEDLAIAGLKLVGVTAILAWLDGPLALLVVGLMPLAALYALHFNRRMGAALKLSRQRIGEINARVEDSLAGIRVVKSFANEDLETRRFDVENDRFLESRRVGYLSEAFFSAGTATFAQLLTVLVIVLGGIRVVQGGLDVAGMVTFLLCVAVLVDPIQRLANFARLWQQGWTGFERVMEILETRPDVRDRPGARDLPRPRGAIAFRDVGFGYEGAGPVFRNLSLDIRAGEFVALVGASGVGKSTLCALVPRFYDVADGRILVDGTDVRDVTVASLRRHIGIVQQDVYLFAGTVADNLRYGRPEASDAEVAAAAKAANAHDFILALPQGYDTDIGQRGVKLSGGQKQRLTIARAFLKDPPILIFDEATSALDNESERAVQDALFALSRQRTTLVIAHRLSTVRHADRILVLTPAGIAEEGTHEQLVAAGGVYAGLYRMQASI